MVYLNRFKQLQDIDDFVDYREYEDTIPYNKIIDGKWKNLEPHKISKFIKYRFSSDYSGLLLWKEINFIKKILDNKSIELEIYKNKVRSSVLELKVQIYEEEKICNSNSLCKKQLDDHLNTCSSKYHKCTKNFLSYECKFTNNNNGRCTHYYKIESLIESLEHYQCNIYESEQEIMELEIQYERELARKENRLKEYYEDEDDDSYFY